MDAVVIAKALSGEIFSAGPMLRHGVGVDVRNIARVWPWIQDANYMLRGRSHLRGNISNMIIVLDATIVRVDL